MSKINSLLSERLKQAKGPPKMAALSRQSSDGHLTSFAGVFGVTELSDQEKEELQLLLERYAEENQDIACDLRTLAAITSEVKAITNQAAVLHGERIKRAQTVLKSYREGAFTAWMMATYGNRQTPYNLLQYYEFYAAMPKQLHPLIETMPRQAIYTLASRSGPSAKKEEIVRNSRGQTKETLLNLIRETFPLSSEDKRAGNAGQQVLKTLKQTATLLRKRINTLSKKQKTALLEELKKIEAMLN
jgi:hypothetical protein